MYLTGPGTIYLEQNILFKRPVYFEDTITAEETLEEIVNQEKNIYRLKTVVYNQNDEIVVDGYAVVKILSKCELPE